MSSEQDEAIKEILRILQSFLVIPTDEGLACTLKHLEAYKGIGESNTKMAVFDSDVNNLNSTIFNVGGEELLRLSAEGFFYKGERVDDIHDVYTRFNEWMTTAEQDKIND